MSGQDPIDYIGQLHGSYREELSMDDFNRLSRFIYSIAGIKLPPAKRVMLQSRLHKRLRELDIPNFHQYAEYVMSQKGQQEELVHMLDVVSTNKTDFFREPAHFEYLRNEVLPLFVKRGGRQFKVWSAACSSGEEPYSIAMTLATFASQHPGFDYSIFATDLSTRILAQAKNAVYREERVNMLTLEQKQQFLLRSKDRTHPTVRIAPQLRNKVRFERLNFMDESYSSVHETFDQIFCRNVLIYFDRPTQESVIRKLCTKLKTGGFFFLGHSESVMSMNLPLRQLKPTIFIKEEK